jgi:hypothetical protein
MNLRLQRVGVLLVMATLIGLAVSSVVSASNHNWGFGDDLPGVQESGVDGLRSADGSEVDWGLLCL